MYQNAAMLAAFLLIYSAVAGRIERSLISGPIVFTAVGLILDTVTRGRREMKRLAYLSHHGLRAP